MEDLGQKLEARVGGYGVREIRDAMLPPGAKKQVNTFMTQREGDLSDEDAAQPPSPEPAKLDKTARLGQSQSAAKIGNMSLFAGSNNEFNATSSKMMTRDIDVSKSLSNIESKIVKA